MAEPHELVFQEAARLLARQEASLDTLRTRALGVLTAGGLVTGVLGAQAGAAKSATLVALALTAVSAILAALVHRPIQFTFSHDLGHVLDRLEDREEMPLTTTDVAFNWARDLNSYRRENAPRIARLVILYQVMCALLGLELCAAVAAVAFGR